MSQSSNAEGGGADQFFTELKVPAPVHCRNMTMLFQGLVVQQFGTAAWESWRDGDGPHSLPRVPTEGLEVLLGYFPVHVREAIKVPDSESCCSEYLATLFRQDRVQRLHDRVWDSESETQESSEGPAQKRQRVSDAEHCVLHQYSNCSQELLAAPIWTCYGTVKPLRCCTACIKVGLVFRISLHSCLL